MKITIIIGALIFLATGIFIMLPNNEEVSTEQPDNLGFVSREVTFAVSDIKWATTTENGEKDGKEIRTGIRIPVTYDVNSESTIEEIEMNLDSYNQCRNFGKTKEMCVRELNDDIEKTVEAFKINKARELNELRKIDYKDELNF